MNNFPDSYVKHSTIHKMQYKDNIELLIVQSSFCKNIKINVY